MKVKLIASTGLGGLVCGIAARTCISETCPGIDDPEKSMKSLKQALNSHHESVLEHWSATFAIEEVSRVLEIQLVRHRLASYSIQSGRYCARDPTNYVVPFEPDDAIERAMMNFDVALMHVDDVMKAHGVKEEDRRYLYPQGLKTNIVVTMNARELRHFLGLRLCVRAQKEIRELAERMLECLKDECPELFEDIGPQCEQLGYCREKKGCGRYPDLFSLGEEYWIGHPYGPRGREGI